MPAIAVNCWCLGGACTRLHREGVIAGFDPRGKTLFAGAAAMPDRCQPATRYATLTGARAVNDPSATNVAQIILQGTARDTPHGKVFMPAFGSTFSDPEIAALANYVTARFGAQPSRITAKDIAKLRQEN